MPDRRSKHLNTFQIIDVHTSFDAVKDHLEEIAEVIPPYNQNTATIQAIPDRMFDVLSRAQIMLTSATGADIPLRRHGEGSHIHRLKYDSQEILLCMDGYGEFYKKNVPSDSFSTTSDHTTLDYWRYVLDNQRGNRGRHGPLQT